MPHIWPPELAEHDGAVWYRKWIDVPAEWRSRQLSLRFAGIDDDALIYVNAHEVGYSCGWHRPFQVDVGETDRLRHAQPHRGADQVSACGRARLGHGFTDSCAITR